MDKRGPDGVRRAGRVHGEKMMWLVELMFGFAMFSLGVGTVITILWLLAAFAVGVTNLFRTKPVSEDNSNLPIQDAVICEDDAMVWQRAEDDMETFLRSSG